MITRAICLATLVTLSGSAGSLFAQSQPARRPIPYPVVPPASFQQAVAQGTRTMSGEPGPAYWQQWTDYTLRARLIPEEKLLAGSAKLVYHNRSPGPLPFVALQLLQNLHAPGAQRNEQQEVTGGIQLGRVAVAGQSLHRISSPREGAGYLMNGTNMIVLPPRPVAAGDSVTIELEWAFQIPQQGASERMGFDSDNLFHIAYWYPQAAVYDDLQDFSTAAGFSGWQLDQFTGGTEFYAGFGNYDLTVEAPEGWVISATGTLQNPEEVLPAAIIERIARAAQSDDVVHILTEADLGPGKATLTSDDNGYLKWRFHSDSVRDVVFSATTRSLWDAARTPVGDRDGDGTTDYATVHALWRTSAQQWSQMWRYAQHSIDFLSRFTTLPYPWPHMTVVEGNGIIQGGMEFPMMTLIGGYQPGDDAGLYSVTAHELGHMWFPMTIASDERRYAWIDEGTTQFNTTQAENDFYPDVDHEAPERAQYLQIANLGLEGELMRRSDFHYSRPAYGTASYSKPASILIALRGLIGTETFERGFHTFIHNWAFKHPTAWDLFNTFNTASGQNLDWFWRSWYYETWTLDHAVASVTPGSRRTLIVIEDRGLLPMPARVTITLANGDVTVEEVPVETWLEGKTTAELMVPSVSPVVRVEIDAAHVFPDIDRRNDVWDRDRR